MKNEASKNEKLGIRREKMVGIEGKLVCGDDDDDVEEKLREGYKQYRRWLSFSHFLRFFPYF